jgi:hypothetical protein
MEMAIPVHELMKWLETFASDDLVEIDEGGLELRIVGDNVSYYEVGGLPEEDEE